MSAPVPTCPSGHRLLLGKNVLITAAAGTGIGFAAARRCAEEGAFVVLSDIHERRLLEAAERLEPVLGRRPPTILCDVTQEDDVQRMFAFAADAVRARRAEPHSGSEWVGSALPSPGPEDGGGIDVLVNNAGLGGTCAIVDMDDAQWHKVLDVSLTGTFRCLRAALRHMMPRKTGAIVNNASVLGWRAQAGQAHYAAAKAGVMALTRCAAVEAAPAGVRVNAVAPSLAMHPFLEKVTTPAMLATLTEREAFGRAAEPWEVANVIIMLASGYTSYMTGEVVSVSSQRA